MVKRLKLRNFMTAVAFITAMLLMSSCAIYYVDEIYGTSSTYGQVQERVETPAHVTTFYYFPSTLYIGMYGGYGYFNFNPYRDYCNCHYPYYYNSFHYSYYNSIPWYYRPYYPYHYRSPYMYGSVWNYYRPYYRPRPMYTPHRELKPSPSNRQGSYGHRTTTGPTNTKPQQQRGASPYFNDHNQKNATYKPTEQTRQQTVPSSNNYKPTPQQRTVQPTNQYKPTTKPSYQQQTPQRVVPQQNVKPVQQSRPTYNNSQPQRTIPQHNNYTPQRNTYTPQNRTVPQRNTYTPQQTRPVQQQSINYNVRPSATPTQQTRPIPSYSQPQRSYTPHNNSGSQNTKFRR